MKDGPGEEQQQLHSLFMAAKVPGTFSYMTWVGKVSSVFVFLVWKFFDMPALIYNFVLCLILFHQKKGEFLALAQQDCLHFLQIRGFNKQASAVLPCQNHSFISVLSNCDGGLQINYTPPNASHAQTPSMVIMELFIDPLFCVEQALHRSWLIQDVYSFTSTPTSIYVCLCWTASS